MEPKMRVIATPQTSIVFVPYSVHGKSASLLLKAQAHWHVSDTKDMTQLAANASPHKDQAESSDGEDSYPVLEMNCLSYFQMNSYPS